MTKFIKSALLGSAMLFAANLASADIIVTDNFSSNKGWTLDTNWQIGGNIGAPDGMHGFYYATSQAYNLANVSKVNVSFYRWLNTDYDPYMTSQVEAFDGSAWHVIFTNCCVGGAGQIFDSAWTQQSYDVSAYADHNAAFRLRFSYDVTDAGVYTTGGWNVDDLSISGQVPEPGSLMLMGLGLAGFVARRKAKAA
jgi:hypothetical protein